MHQNIPCEAIAAYSALAKKAGISLTDAGFASGVGTNYRITPTYLLGDVGMMEKTWKLLHHIGGIKIIKDMFMHVYIYIYIYVYYALVPCLAFCHLGWAEYSPGLLAAGYWISCNPHSMHYPHRHESAFMLGLV